MQVALSEIGKKYQREWIFKSVTHQFKSDTISAVIGSNGSGKSTLLKLISGAEIPSSGSICYRQQNGEEISLEDVYKKINLVSPYTDLPELLTLRELFDFQNQFNKINYSLDEFSELIYLKKEQNKQIRYYSSGMKQRLKLGLAFFGNAQCLILDEPCSNLDELGIKMYAKFIDQFSGKKTIIIGSNEDPNEIGKVGECLNIMDFK